MPFFRTAELRTVQAAPGVTRRAVWLDHVMLTFFEFEAGAVVPEHAHPHEQITYVIQGALEFTLGDETRVLHAGDGAAIPSNMPHRAVALEPSLVLDGWSPIREDYC